MGQASLERRRVKQAAIKQAAKPKVSAIPLEDYTKAPSSLFMMVPDSVRKTAVVGDFAWMTFINDGGMNERMWVEVTRADNGHYEGCLTNKPIQFSPKVLKVGDIVKFEWNNICNLMDSKYELKTRGLDAIAQYAQHIEALLKMWALNSPLHPLDEKKCTMVAHNLEQMSVLVLEIHDENGLNGGNCCEISFGEGIDGAVAAAECLVATVADWQGDANPNVQKYVLKVVAIHMSFLDLLCREGQNDKPSRTSRALITRLLNDKNVMRRLTPDELRSYFAEQGIDPESAVAKRGLESAEEYAAELAERMDPLSKLLANN